MLFGSQSGVLFMAPDQTFVVLPAWIHRFVFILDITNSPQLQSQVTPNCSIRIYRLCPPHTWATARLGLLACPRLLAPPGEGWVPRGELASTLGSAICTLLQTATPPPHPYSPLVIRLNNYWLSLLDHRLHNAESTPLGSYSCLAER